MSVSKVDVAHPLDVKPFNWVNSNFLLLKCEKKIQVVSKVIKIHICGSVKTSCAKTF